MVTYYKNGTKMESDVPNITNEELDVYYNIVYDYLKGKMYDVQCITVAATDEEDKVDVSFDRKNTMKFERLDRVNNVAPTL